MDPGIDEKRWRLFIAVRIPEEIKTKMEKAQAELRRALPAGGVAWTRREQFHLTLEFMGDVAAHRAGELAEAVRRTCQEFTRLRLRAQRVGFFPNIRAPRVIWVGITDAEDRLLRLQQALEAAVRSFTLEQREQKFGGHATLGRVKHLTRSGTKLLTLLAAGMAGRFFGEWTADGVELMRSELSPHGAFHTTIVKAPFADLI